MPVNWVGTWEGGRIRFSRGKRIFMIERSIDGRRYSLSLDVATEREAGAELVRFEKAPAAYLAARQGHAAPDAKPLTLDEATIAQFTAWARSEEMSEPYVAHTLEKYLSDWGEALGGRDLRQETTVHLRQLLAGWKLARKNRITALKSFTAWCRNEAGLLSRQTDPTLDLQTMKPKKRRAEDERKAFELGDVEAVYRAIDYQLVRDDVCLSFHTGLHQTEISRFAAGGGQLRAVGPWEGCPIVGTLRVNHKNGDPHTVSLGAQAFAAAQRIQAAGGISGSWCYQHLQEVAKRHSLPHLLLGSARHSFVTWCRTPGLGVRKWEPPQPAVSLEDVAAVTGHRSTSTTRHHYDEAQHVPHLLQVPLRLVHPDDPPLNQVVRLGRSRVRDDRR